MEAFLTAHWQLIAGPLVMSVVAHALQTMPPITNSWVKWPIDVLQFFVANYNKLDAPK